MFFCFQILQNLGKADKTTDEIFEEHLQNFNTQQVNATRLHKDINNYLRCIRGQWDAELCTRESVLSRPDTFYQTLLTENQFRDILASKINFRSELSWLFQVAIMMIGNFKPCLGL